MKNDGDDYRVMNARRRLIIVLLAIATTMVLVLTLVSPPNGAKRTGVAVPQCSASQSTECVGGKADVIFVPLSAVTADAAASAGATR